MNKVYFGFGVHCHQPVGNYPHVFEECFNLCYDPFFKELNKFPDVIVNTHISGPLLEWMAENKPEFIALMKGMIDRGQIEILGGPFYEVILPLISADDIKEQITQYTRYIGETFNSLPTGMWLPERVWEQYLTKPIALSGMDYTLLDDYHFNGAGWLNDKLHGYFITEHEGYKLKILPIMESLRYTMPALKPPDVIDYIKKTGMDAGGGMRIAMGDIEKFGVWPKSYKIIYEDGWLHAFFQELSERQKKSDVMTIKFSDYIKQFPSDGNIYIPSGSYSEMGRWSMPYESGTQFWPVLDEVKNTAPDRKSPWMHFVRGGFFRNMLVKYPESNSMHKKMLKLSRDIKEFEEHPDFQKMQKHLFRGQCNCAYWHGVFGGVYIKHLRQALFHELLQCEKLLHQAQGGGISICQDDTIFYGQNEIQATSDRYSIHLHPVIGANVSEFSEFRTCHNMGFVMRRRREVYHNVVSETTLTKEDKSPSREDSKIPEKQAIIDWYDRSSFIMHFFHPDTKINDLKKCTYGEQGDFINQEFDLTVDSDKKKITCVRNGHVWQREGALGIRVTKIFEFPESDEFVFKWTIENTSDTIAHLVPGIEMNILPSNEQTSKFRIAEKEVSCSGLFEGKGNEVILDDKEYNLKMKYSCGEEYRIWSFPVNSVCRFETGFTDVFQGVSLTFLKTVNLKPGAGVSGIMKIIAE